MRKLRAGNDDHAGPSLDREYPVHWCPHNTLKETPLVRCFVFLCESVEEWRIQNEWIVQKTHTSETSVSRARPQAFSPLLNTYAQEYKTSHKLVFCL